MPYHSHYGRHSCGNSQDGGCSAACYSGLFDDDDKTENATISPTTASVRMDLAAGLAAAESVFVAAGWGGWTMRQSLAPKAGLSRS